MNKKMLYALWGGLYILCAALGFIPEPAGFVRALLTMLSLGFFVPPALLLYDARKTGDRYTPALVRNLSALSLLLTLVLLVVNVLSVMNSEAVGNILYGILVIVTSPMVCSGYWVLSMFCWACLLLTAIGMLRRKK